MRRWGLQNFALVQGLLHHVHRCEPSASTLSVRSWLESGGPEVQGLLRAERQHAHAWLQRCAQHADKLRAAMLQEVPEAQVGWEDGVLSIKFPVCWTWHGGSRKARDLSDL